MYFLRDRYCSFQVVYKLRAYMIGVIHVKISRGVMILQVIIWTVLPKSYFIFAFTFIPAIQFFPVFLTCLWVALSIFA